jgi:hypothetical protein
VETRMKVLLLAGILLLLLAGATVANADDCTGKLTAEQNQTYASLSPANQQVLAHMKNKDGTPVTCEFRAGLLDILDHYPPDKRDAGLQQMLQHTFAKQD